MNIFITGTSSTFGAALTEMLFRKGANIYTCNKIPDESVDIEALILEKTKAQPIDIVILCQAAEIPFCHDQESYNSYVQDLVRFNCDVSRFFTEQSKRPITLLSASSLDIYEPSFTSPAIETSPLGTDITAQSYKQVERSVQAAVECGIRVVHLRLSHIISHRVPPHLLKLPLIHSVVQCRGDKRKIINWVSSDDAVRAVQHILQQDELHGPVNIVSGDAPTKSVFLQEITAHFKLRLSLPLPRFIFNIFRRTRRHTVMFNSQCKAIPMKLLEHEFFFEDISLTEYLQNHSSKIL